MKNKMLLHRRSSILRWSVRVILLFFVFSCSFAASNYETTYAEKQVECTDTFVEAQIHSNGTVSFHETRTIRFDGSFTYGYYILEKNKLDKIENFSLEIDNRPLSEARSDTEENGTFYIEDNLNEYKIWYYFQAENETKEISFHYTILGNIEVYEDFGVFDWYLQGPGWELPVDSFTGNVTWDTPIPMDDYYIWGHGPLQGSFTKIDDNHAIASCDDVNAKEVIHALVLLPSTYFQSNLVQPGTIYQTTVEKETKLANEANFKRVIGDSFQ